MADLTVPEATKEERTDMILRATYQIERLCMALADAAGNGTEGIEDLTMGIVGRIGQLNGVIMGAAGDGSQTTLDLANRLRGDF